MGLEVKKSLYKRVLYKPSWRSIGFIVVAAVLILGLFFIGLFSWYKQGLTAKNPREKNKIHLTIEKGDTNNAVAKKLQNAGLIKNATAFEWYQRVERPKSIIKAGRYALAPSLSAEQIIKHLEKGKTDLFIVTIIPGRTLEEIKKGLLKYGYQKTEIDAAVNAAYTHPLLADRPVGQDLEGYLFPESFEVQVDTSLQTLFTRDFDTLYGRLKNDGLIDKFKARGLNLHQALTMASIVQKETGVPGDQQKVAQVLYTRLSIGMKLETDPTFIYAAKKMGVEPSVSLDSPYNTRLYPGLPPGPISNSGYSALRAVAEPAATDFLYFVAGDDGTTHFSHTIKEHQDLTKKYCHKLCN